MVMLRWGRLSVEFCSGMTPLFIERGYEYIIFHGENSELRSKGRFSIVIRKRETIHWR
jgi:hypothetical protein